MRVMLECLLEDIGMRQEFTMLQEIFCMRSLAMVEWVRKFCRNLNRDMTLSSLKHNDVTIDLQVFVINISPVTTGCDESDKF